MLIHRRVTHSRIPISGISQSIENETVSPWASRRVSSSERMKYNWKDWRRVTPLLTTIVFASSLLALPITHAFSPSLRTFSRFHQHQQHRSSFASPTNLINHTVKQRHRVVLSSHSSDDVVSVSTTTTTVIAPETATTTDETLADQLVYQTAVQNTLAWVGAAVLFGGALGFLDGPTTASEFFAGYLVEQSLSVDNLFVFLLLFEYFGVPLAYQNRVLNWGIAGAVLMRATMIGLGAAALSQYRAILLVFAGILVYSSASFFLGDDDDDESAEDPSENSIVQFSKSLLPSTDTFDGDRFFTISDGVRKATPLFICMVAVEISDIVFAVDSIPAVFGVTEVCTTITYRNLPKFVISISHTVLLTFARTLWSSFHLTCSQSSVCAACILFSRKLQRTWHTWSRL